MTLKTSTEILADIKSAAVKRLTTLNPENDTALSLIHAIFSILEKVDNTAIATTIKTEMEAQAKLNAIQASGADLVVAGSIGEIEVEIPDGATLEATVTSGDGAVTII